MSRKKEKPPSLAALLDLLELRQSVMAHCTAIKSVTLLMEKGKVEAAMARLEGAVLALEYAIRGQCTGFKMACPNCRADQGLEAWVDRQRCDACGGFLDFEDDE